MLEIVFSFLIFTNLIQIEEKMHMSVTVCFPDYALNENIPMHFFMSGMLS